MFTNLTALEIQFGDCDPAGIVYYPNYFRFFDNATAAMMAAALGLNKRLWRDKYGVLGIPMVDTGAKFHRPARFGDVVEIETKVTRLGTSSFSIAHRLTNAGALAIEAHEVRVWTVRDPQDPAGIKAAPLPQDVRTALG